MPNAKFTMTVAEETEKWLNDEYPEALDTQEAVRMAIQDARDYREAAELVGHVSDIDDC